MRADGLGLEGLGHEVCLGNRCCLGNEEKVLSPKSVWDGLRDFTYEAFIAANLELTSHSDRGSPLLRLLDALNNPGSVPFVV